MWKNEYKDTINRNILLFVILACVVLALFTSYLHVKKKINAEDSELRAANSSQRQQLNDTRQENLEAVQQAYETDMATVGKYLPGIVCWGDSLTAGTSGNVSYPQTLQKYINVYLCDVYDFRSSIENAADYPKLNWHDYKVTIPVVNMGSGQDNTATTLGRAGVKPYQVKTAFVIPAETESVTVALTSPGKKQVTPLSAGDVGINPVTIGGVKGVLSMEYTDGRKSHYNYKFTRLEPGDEVSIEAGTQVITAASDQFTDYFHIIWLGTYDKDKKAHDLVEDVKLMLSRRTGITDRYLVIGPCTTGGEWNSTSSETLDAIDSAMLYAFGNHYINARKYLIEDGLMDAKLNPTQNDAQNLKKGFVPNSFRSNAEGADLNSIAYKHIGKLIFDRMGQLGYFTEIQDELNLKKSTQELLKNDPYYFEKQFAEN